MKYLFWVLMLFAAAVAMTLASHTPAFVLILYGQHKITFSLILFVLLLVTLFVLGYSLVRFIITALQLPLYVRNFREERSQNKRRAMLDQALLAYFEGRYAAAEKAAADAMTLGETSPVYPLIAARAAHALQQYVKRDTYLSTLEEGNVMRQMATAEFMLEQRQPESALAALQTLAEAGGGSHVAALRLALKAHQQAEHWDEALQVLEQLERRDAVESTTATLLRQQAFLAGIARQHDLPALQTYWKNLPGEFRQRSKLAAAAARALLALGADTQAADILAESLEKHWDSELIGLYGDCHSSEALKQIERAEIWLKRYSEDAALLLTLGKLCTYQQLWGKAKTYLDASIGIAPSAAAYTALGQLTEKLGASPFTYYQRAAELSKRAS